MSGDKAVADDTKKRGGGDLHILREGGTIGCMECLLGSSEQNTDTETPIRMWRIVSPKGETKSYVCDFHYTGEFGVDRSRWPPGQWLPPGYQGPEKVPAPRIPATLQVPIPISIPLPASRTTTMIISRELAKKLFPHLSAEIEQYPSVAQQLRWLRVSEIERREAADSESVRGQGQLRALPDPGTGSESVERMDDDDGPNLMATRRVDHKGT